MSEANAERSMRQSENERALSRDRYDAVLLDLDGVITDTASVHTGLGGMRDHDGRLSFWPRRAPEDNAILRFPVTYRGQMLEVEIGQEKVEYALREGECLVIRHETEEIQLTREQPIAVRPVSRW
jgi:hypothetical protein